MSILFLNRIQLEDYLLNFGKQVMNLDYIELYLLKWSHSWPKKWQIRFNYHQFKRYRMNYLCLRVRMMKDTTQLS